MKSIKIKFLYDCFDEGFNSINDTYIDLLSKHFDVIESESPEYLFSYEPRGDGVVGDELDYYHDCVRCQISVENNRPNFNIYDFAIGNFHNIKYGNRYLYLPPQVIYHSISTNFTPIYSHRCKWNDILNKHKEITDDMAKRDFCGFVVSNKNVADYEREHFYKKLSEYKHIDSGGKFMNNIGSVVEDYFEFASDHKFMIAFENAWNAAITEKLDNAFAAKTVPIYWGNTDIEDLYNSKSFVNCHNYKNFDEVIERIIEIDNDDDIYLNMLKEPAFHFAKSEYDYLLELEKFLVNMITMPKQRAIIRTNVGWSRVMQEVYKSGIKEHIRRGVEWFYNADNSEKLRI